MSNTSSVNNASSSDAAAALTVIGMTDVLHGQGQLQQLREKFKETMSDSDS